MKFLKCKYRINCLALNRYYWIKIETFQGLKSHLRHLLMGTIQIQRINQAQKIRFQVIIWQKMN